MRLSRGRSRRKPQPPISCSASSDLQQVHALCTLLSNNPSGQTESSRSRANLFPLSGLFGLPQPDVGMYSMYLCLDFASM